MREEKTATSVPFSIQFKNSDLCSIQFVGYFDRIHGANICAKLESVSLDRNFTQYSVGGGLVSAWPEEMAVK